MPWKDTYEEILQLNQEARRVQMNAADDLVAQVAGDYSTASDMLRQAQNCLQDAMDLMLLAVREQNRKEREAQLALAERTSAVAEQVDEDADEREQEVAGLANLSILDTQVPPLPEAPPEPVKRPRGRPKKTVRAGLDETLYPAPPEHPQSPEALPLPVELEEQPMVGEEISEFLAGEGRFAVDQTPADESTETYEPADVDDGPPTLPSVPPSHPITDALNDLADLRF